jgi:hypothetical protein
MRVRIEFDFESGEGELNAASQLELLKMWLTYQCETALEVVDPENDAIRLGEIVISCDNVSVEIV